MPIHKENKIVPYSPHQMYQLVLDVDRYPGFLPWIQSAHVYDRTEAVFYADLTVGSSVINQSYSSKVTFGAIADSIQTYRIDVRHTKGPFHHLHNYWIFKPYCSPNTPLDYPPTHTEIEFFLDFEISNPFLKPLLQPFLNQAVHLMVDAFEKRAHALFT